LSGNPDPGLPGDDDPVHLEDEDIDTGEIDEGDEPEVEEAEPPEVEADQETEQPRQRPRSSDTIRNLRARAQQAELERDFFQRQAQQQQPRQQPQPDPQAQAAARRAEMERISLLAPDQQMEAIDRLVDQKVAVAEFRQLDRSDQMAFKQMQDSVPAARRLAPEVEQMLQGQRAQGIYGYTREQIYHYLLGREVHNRSTQNAGRQRQAGQRNVARQTTRPGGNRNRGDVSTGTNRSRSGDADRDMLMNTRIEDL
jgi:pyruvate/2-oxoglutarate dehydrogenase complex dihydrolipoamide acyltransferase (E2) component